VRWDLFLSIGVVSKNHRNQVLLTLDRELVTTLEAIQKGRSRNEYLIPSLFPTCTNRVCLRIRGVKLNRLSHPKTKHKEASPNKLFR
jgi:hypothetical protein